jgi:hypothetical protein
VMGISIVSGIRRSIADNSVLTEALHQGRTWNSPRFFSPSRS